MPPAPAPILAQVEITSFGYLHGTPPTAHITVDLRHHYRDPHVRPELRHLTAHDQTVRDTVLGTAGIPALLDSLTATIAAYAAGPRTGPITIAVGCAGGRHRAATVAAELAHRIPGATLIHRDLHQSVVER
ncbi:ATPase [Streptomyces sp. KK5PA1]|uniref:ATPase n=2 Tax=Actinacidiphila acididurans TaxID=2784346 RepID=A0ABS2U483_9ACTN|nr:ATPase [Actinacidiphila acididurans]